MGNMNRKSHLSTRFHFLQPIYHICILNVVITALTVLIALIQPYLFPSRKSSMASLAHNVLSQLFESVNTPVHTAASAPRWSGVV